MYFTINIILDMWIWPTVSGELPPPCIDSGLTRIDHHRALLFGGYGVKSMWIEPDVYVLDLQHWVSN